MPPTKKQSDIIYEDYYKIPSFEIEECIVKQYRKKIPAMKKDNTYAVVAKSGLKLMKYNNEVVLGQDIHNYTILTGLINNLLVLDLDISKDEWKTLGNNHPFIQWGISHFGDDCPDEDWKCNLNNIIDGINTFTIKTPSGGFHLYFNKTDWDKPMNHKLRKLQIDIQGEGALVVGFNSSFDGEIFYEVYKDVEINYYDNYGDLWNLLIYHCEEETIEYNKTKFKERRLKYEKSKSNDVFTYDFTNLDANNLCNMLPDTVFTDSKSWLHFTSFCKLIGKKKLWLKYSKKDPNFSTQNYEIKNEACWKSAKAGFVEFIFNQANRMPELVYYKYKETSPITKSPNQITEFTKLEYIEGRKDYLTNMDHNRRNGSVVVQADTGTGKTTMAVELLGYSGYIRYISITSRVSLAEEQYKLFQNAKLRVKYYKNIPGKQYANMEGQSLVIQLESLYRISTWNAKHYIIFIDEFNSVLGHLFSSETLKSKRKQTFKLFCNMLKNAKQVIGVDADISDMCFTLLDELNIEYQYKKNLTLHNKGITATELLSFDVMIDEIKTHSKYLICCDSATEADNIYKALDDTTIKLYTAKCEDVIDITNDKVIISPKVIYGLDSTIGRPVFGYFTERTITPQGMAQQICRERDITALYFCFPNKTKKNFDYTFNTRKDVSEFIEFYDEKHRTEYGLEMSDMDADGDELYSKLMSQYLFDNDASFTNPRKHFINILNKKGFAVNEYKEKSYGLNLITQKQNKHMRLEDEIEVFKSLKNEEISEWLERHRKIQSIVCVPVCVLTQEFSPILMNVFTDQFGLKQHLNICNLFINSYDSLLTKIKHLHQNEYAINIQKDDLPYIKWIRDIMTECEMPENTLNAITVLSEKEHSEFVATYNKFKKERTAHFSCAKTPKQPSLMLSDVVKKLCGDDIIVKKRSKGSDGKNTYNIYINKTVKAEHTSIQQYRYMDVEECVIDDDESNCD